jgi:hypothetical protein
MVIRKSITSASVSARSVMIFACQYVAQPSFMIFV